MKIALVGCGRISRNHFESIKELPELELVGVCDIVPERAQEAGEKYNAPWFVEYGKMLDETRPEIVSICTPSGLHPDHAIQAARRGIHVIT